MAQASPDWLARRGGTLKLGSDGHTWLVMLNQQPHYTLAVVPVGGKFGCAIKQTINGERVPSAGTFSSLDEAIGGGLEDLRKTLGWG